MKVNLIDQLMELVNFKSTEANGRFFNEDEIYQLLTNGVIKKYGRQFCAYTRILVKTQLVDLITNYQNKH